MRQPSPAHASFPVYPTTVSPHRSLDHIADLYQCLEQHLEPAWELYPRPFLNGDYPALAALHPIHGLTIFGIFDWDLRHYRCEQRGRYLRYSKRVGNSQQPVQSPVRQTEHYIENLINLYLPHIGESIARDRRSLASFQIALYFPHHTTYAAQVFAPMAPGRGTVFGYDAVQGQDLALLLPAAQRPGNRALPDDWINGLRFWLAPPMHVASVQQPLELTTEQKRHVTPAPGHHQRLHGVAGSGKTLVIAQRAANLAAAGKRVLVVTFNTTLWQYIRQLVARSPVDFAWENIEFHHFHGFCKNVLTENGVEWPRSNSRKAKHALDEVIPQLVIDTCQANDVELHDSEGNDPSQQRRYDAILIDEGQDFLANYYEMLCHFLTENDEVLFVADRRQNLYLRDASWLDNMRGTKFRGRWREMKQSYRLPTSIAQEMNRFAAQFFDGITALTTVADPAEPLPSTQIELFTDGIYDNSPSAVKPAPGAHWEQREGKSSAPILCWYNLNDLDTIIDKLQQTVRWLLQTQRVKLADIVVLTPNHKDGLAVASALEHLGFAVNHILSADDGYPGRKQRRFRKRTFAPDDERLKVSTIHGFKGWELQTVLLLTPTDNQLWESQSPYLFYVAMTRTRQNLFVFNRHPLFREYGKAWNERYHDPIAVFTT